MQTNDPEYIAKLICKKRGMRFVRQVGEGAFKQTFHVIDRFDFPLALKIYKATSASLRDEREVKAMRKCNHRNIARLISLENIKSNGQQFFALTEEFLPGGTLTSKGQLTVSEVIRIGGQLVEALRHLANLNLVHRDIKPDNIMFRADGATPVLSDFGVVRDLSDSSITPTWVARGPGTPLFAAPEQLNNQKNMIDWRTDQFSLGVVAAYVALGEHPYRVPGKSDRELVDSVSTRQPPAEWFKQRSHSTGLTSLPRMIAPWPIDRYRKPAHLGKAWREQGG